MAATICEHGYEWQRKFQLLLYSLFIFKIFSTKKQEGGKSIQVDLQKWQMSKCDFFGQIQQIQKISNQQEEMRLSGQNEME